MERINKTQFLDLSVASKQFNHFSEAQVVGYNPLSFETNFMLDQSITLHQTLIINDTNIYASPHKGKCLLADLDGGCLHTHSQKERLLNRTLGFRYRYPLMTSQGIFSPLEKHVWQSGIWLNIMQITTLKSCHDSADCAVTFRNGYQLLLPKSLRAIKRSIKKDLVYSYVYFSFFERLLSDDLGARPKYSSKVSEKAAELSLVIPVEMNLKTYDKMKDELEYIVTQDYFKRMGQPELLEEMQRYN
ncbi:hypothetical protein G7081_00325 [Vagococcus coleopterorum]|uniref:ComK protein n=1 Tax=Vagococcus coleopterorum TaxID=2714946 RepID=A0A6G8AKY8_9ENTE|nr:hypothetical protein [Vagococcus coleopterorum]QIL45640.1 hypothetical protein G7081_00325 [Vagococcus coleopterorum]